MKVGLVYSWQFAVGSKQLVVPPSPPMTVGTILGFGGRSAVGRSQIIVK